MLEIIGLALIGVALGTVTGLVPGIHVNTVVLIILSVLPALLTRFPAHSIAGLIVAMAIVHSYVDYIPSIFLGAPSEDSVLSVLPGHKLLLKGRGYEAVQLTVIGGVGSTILSLVMLGLVLAVLPTLYSRIIPLVPYLLTTVIAYMVLVQNRSRWLWAAIAVMLSGVLGIIILELGVINPGKALFPALTGLFGISTLYMSQRTILKIPVQHITSTPVEYGKGVAIGSLAGLVSGILPSLGPSQSATIIQSLFKSGGDEKEFLVAMGGVNTANSLFAFLALYLIERSRSGASIAVKEILSPLSQTDMLFIIGVTLFTTFFAAALTLKLAKTAAAHVPKINYRKFSTATIIFLIALTISLTGLKGLLILVTASAIGVFVQAAGVNRSTCMTVLMIPTILYFLS